jgi:hypothetical protein
MHIRLIRRVEGRRGSVSLYQCPRRLAEVVRVTEEGREVLELLQHEQEMLAPLLKYLDEVQKGIDASRPAKRTRARRLGSMCKRRAGQPGAKRSAGGGA